MLSKYLIRLNICKYKRKQSLNCNVLSTLSDQIQNEINQILNKKIDKLKGIQLIINSSNELSQLIVNRLTTKQISNFMNNVRSIDKNNRFNIIKKSDKSIAKFLTKVIYNEDIESTDSIYPLTIPALFDKDSHNVASKLAYCLYTVKKSINITSFNTITNIIPNNDIASDNTINENNVSNELLDEATDLSIKLVTSIPHRSINQLINSIQLYATEELGGQALQKRLVQTLSVHIDHFDDLFNYLELIKSTDLKFKLESTRIRKQLICRELTHEIDKLSQPTTSIDRVENKNVSNNKVNLRYQCLQVVLNCKGSVPIQSPIYQTGGYETNDSSQVIDQDNQRNNGVSSKRKLFIGNVPNDVSQYELELAMRNIGLTTNVWLYKVNNAIDSSHSIVTSDSSTVSTTSNAPNLIFQELEEGESPPPRHPLASLTSIELVKYKVKKRVVKNERFDNHAFVLMADDKGYQRALGEDLRVLGLCIHGHACRIIPSIKLTTIIVECIRMLSVDDIDKFFTSLLLPGLTISFSKDTARNLKPVFVFIYFDNHESAWMMYDVLQREYNRGMPFRPQWTPTNWYYEVKMKDKTFHIKKLSESNTF